MSHRPLDTLPFAFKVAASLSEVPLARHRVVDRAREAGLLMDDQMQGDLELMAGELIANAVVHTGAPFVVCVRRAGERLRVEVTDVGVVAPSTTAAGEDAETGRGLFLVEALADAWGVAPDRAGKTVWFEKTVCPASLPHPVDASPVTRLTGAGGTGDAPRDRRPEGVRTALSNRGQQDHKAA
ncbi:ATP-binding protein [Streptomyces sp. NPDC058672]|uniref:ATP-binding protein n=1 Tax=Streptomyces sp. NPDC058672 TaxID=3346591 RepID=UPI00365CAA47